MGSQNYISDNDLFQFFKAGNVDAFQELYIRNYPGLIREANRKNGFNEESKDIVQDIFLSLFQKAKDIDIKISIKAYLLQALRYRILNNQRDLRIHNNCHYEFFLMQNSTNDFARELEARELSTSLHLAIKILPKKCKQVFLLSREANYSHKHISDKLNISISTVEKHIGKALKIIKTELRYNEKTAFV
ncbi:RNA polymerase sigma factor [Arachidicoccus sp.]|uniref:RNA polymerase sigma factor n=1 Tax=Arachidicoccus sp. TaxID=1872624 RepID=UPI003D1B4AD3